MLKRGQEVKRGGAFGVLGAGLHRAFTTARFAKNTFKGYVLRDTTARAKARASINHSFHKFNTATSRAIAGFTGGLFGATIGATGVKEIKRKAADYDLFSTTHTQTVQSIAQIHQNHAEKTGTIIKDKHTNFKNKTTSQDQKIMNMIEKEKIAKAHQKVNKHIKKTHIHDKKQDTRFNKADKSYENAKNVRDVYKQKTGKDLGDK